MQSWPLVEASGLGGGLGWFPIRSRLMLLCVTVSVVLAVVWFDGVEMVKLVELGRVWMVTVAVAVREVVPLAVAAVVSVNDVAPDTAVATLSGDGIPVPVIDAPLGSQTGEAVVTVVLPLVVVAVKVLVPAPTPVTLMFKVRSDEEGVVMVALPAVVLAVMVEERPVVAIHGLRVVPVPPSWQKTQKVRLVEALYWLEPRFGFACAAPLKLTLLVSPSWL